MTIADMLRKRVAESPERMRLWSAMKLLAKLHPRDVRMGHNGKVFFLRDRELWGGVRYSSPEWKGFE